MYSEFLKIINRFIIDIHLDEPHVLRRLFPVNCEYIRPLLFTNKTRQYENGIEEKLQRYLQEFSTTDTTITKDVEENEAENNNNNNNGYNSIDSTKETSSLSIYKLIVEILRKCEEFYCHNNAIIGPLVDEWKHLFKNNLRYLNDDSFHEKERIQRFLDEFCRHIGAWIIVADDHKNQFLRISHMIRWICSHIHIPYRVPVSSLFNDHNNDDDDYYNDCHHHDYFALRISISIVYHLIQYRIYLLDHFYQCLEEIQKLSMNSSMMKSWPQSSSGQLMNINPTTATTTNT
ncbi:uncharacterized protein LOC124497532 [Dermatophagoides farinae]|uniref:uncharacterized protein LOC124497532 n=1 Tax=Dermatophagoides farinae TaxID=6954 RepID=UPI003F627647